jgi:hypothetical protein
MQRELNNNSAALSSCRAQALIMPLLTLGCRDATQCALHGQTNVVQSDDALAILHFVHQRNASIVIVSIVRTHHFRHKRSKTI